MKIRLDSFFKLTIFLIAFMALCSCKKKSTEIKKDESNSLQSIIDTSNGWEVIGSRAIANIPGASPGISHFELYHLETHSNVADVFLVDFNPITKNSQSHRWQIDVPSKKEVYWKDLDWNVHPGNLLFRSISLKEGDFDYIRGDGYYKGGAMQEEFRTNNTRSNTNKYSVAYGYLGSNPMLGSSQLAKIVGVKKYFSTYPIDLEYYATQRIAHFEHEGKLVIITLDKATDNPLRIYQSTDSVITDINDTTIYPEYALKVKKSVNSFFEPGTMKYLSVQETYIHKNENEYHFCLFFRTSPTNGNLFDIRNFKLNMADLTLTKVDYQYSGFSENEGYLHDMYDRPGHFLKAQDVMLKTQVTYFNGKDQKQITMPAFKSGVAQIHPSLGIVYRKGKLYALTTFNNIVYLLAKDI